MLGDQHYSYWFAKHILPNEHVVRTWLGRFPQIEVDDIIQEAYVIMAEAELGNISNPIAYFYTVCRNLILKHYKKARIVEIVALADVQNDLLADHMPSLEAVADARAELRFLNSVSNVCLSAVVTCLLIARLTGLHKKIVQKIVEFQKIALKNNWRAHCFPFQNSMPSVTKARQYP